MNKPRKIRISRKAINKEKDRIKQLRSISAYKSKRTVIPGPYTNLETALQIKVQLRPSKSIDDREILGTYTEIKQWDERGWYPVYLNLIVPDITSLVTKNGLDLFLAACEKDLNSKDNKYGKMVIIRVVSDHSLDTTKPEQDRFISCLAKTNYKSIKGFWANRGRHYVIIGENQDAEVEEDEFED